MYRIFCMNNHGLLYQLSSQGWVLTEGTTFLSVKDVAKFLFSMMAPALPCGQVMADSYVAEVDGAGTIIRTLCYEQVNKDWAYSNEETRF